MLPYPKMVFNLSFHDHLKNFVVDTFGGLGLEVRVIEKGLRIPILLDGLTQLHQRMSVY